MLRKRNATGTVVTVTGVRHFKLQSSPEKDKPLANLWTAKIELKFEVPDPYNGMLHCATHAIQ